MRSLKKTVSILTVVALLCTLFSVSVFAATDTFAPFLMIDGEKSASIRTDAESVTVDVYAVDSEGGDVQVQIAGVGVEYPKEIVESVEFIPVEGGYSSANVNFKPEEGLITTSDMSNTKTTASTPCATFKFNLKDGITAGEYEFLISDLYSTTYANGYANVDTSDKVTVNVVEPATITGVSPVTVTDKPFGTAVEDLLPAKVEVTTSSSSMPTYQCDVEWDTTGYSATSKEEQKFTGTLKPDEPVEVGDVTTVEATVTLQKIALANDVAITDVPVMQEEGKTYTAEEIKTLLPETAAVGEGDLADTFAVTWTVADDATLDASAIGNKLSVEGTLAADSTNGFYSANGKKVTGQLVVVAAVNEVVKAVVSGVASDGMTLSIKVTRPEENKNEAGEVTVYVNGEKTQVKFGKEMVDAANFAEGETSMTVYLPVQGSVGDPFVVDVRYNGASLSNLSGTNTAADSTIVRRPTSPGSSSGSDNNNKAYTITVADTENGTVKASAASAKSGTEVTLTVTPDAGYKLDKLEVKASNGTTITVTDNKFTMPAYAVTVSATFVEDDAQPTATAQPSGDFIDVSESDWFYDSVMALKELGIINGVTEDTFAPNNNVTRAEFTKMVVNLFGIEATGTTSAFLDCTANDWYTPFVIAATEAGYVTGESAEWFGANDNITREDICTILGRALNLPNVEAQLTFADADEVADYALQYVKNLVDAGIINGYEDNTFRAKNLATRAEAAKMIKGAYDLLQPEEPEATAEPTATATADPEATEEPEATADPEATEAPEATEDPDATAEPTATATAEAE